MQKVVGEADRCEPLLDLKDQIPFVFFLWQLLGFPQNNVQTFRYSIILNGLKSVEGLHLAKNLYSTNGSHGVFIVVPTNADRETLVLLLSCEFAFIVYSHASGSIRDNGS